MKTKLKLIVNAVLFILLFSVCAKGQESLFPEISGWKISEDSEVYDSNNLWDLIDGAADLFLEYYFIDLHTARYINMDSVEIRVELYRHNTPINAFGMYSQERDPGYHFISIGVQGYIEDGVLNFLDGVYYIKLSTYTKGKSGMDAMTLIAKKLDESLKQENSFPKILQCFPETAKQINTEKYVAQNFLGFSFLNSVMTVSYKNDIEFTAFVVITKNPDEVNSVFKKFIDAQSKENISFSDNRSYDVKDQNNGQMKISVKKNFIYGLINCTDKDNAESFMKEFSQKLEMM